MAGRVRDDADDRQRLVSTFRSEAMAETVVRRIKHAHPAILVVCVTDRPLSASGMQMAASKTLRDCMASA